MHTVPHVHVRATCPKIAYTRGLILESNSIILHLPLSPPPPAGFVIKGIRRTTHMRGVHTRIGLKRGFAESPSQFSQFAWRPPTDGRKLLHFVGIYTYERWSPAHSGRVIECSDCQ